MKSLHVQLAATHARYTMSMSMSRVLSSDSSEHSTPLSNNKERRGTNDAPLMRSLSVPDNVHNNYQLSPPCQQSPIVSRGLISYSMSSEICFVKSQSAQPTAGPTATSSKYTRRPSTAFQQPQQQDDDDQAKQTRLPPSPGTLACHGVKVRDFAYESDLPLIPSIPRFRQLVGARPLKRTKRYFEELGEASLLDSDHQHESASHSSQSRPLERKSTEPVIVPERESQQQQQQPYRDVGYTDLSQMPSSSQAAQTSLHHTLTPVTLTTVNRTSTFSSAPLPFPFPPTRKSTVAGGSQESESSTDTPLVTPNGSLTWPTITSDLPASQLGTDNNGSQPPALVHDPTITYSQLGFSPPFSQAPDSDSGAAGTTNTVDALGSPRPTEVASSPLRPPPDLDLDDGHDIAHASSSPSPSPTRLTHAALPLSSPGGPRYFLRRHGSPRQDHTSTPSPHRRRKPSMRAPGPYPSRITPVTRQAAHAVASGSSGRSPRARPLRKTAIP